MTYTARRLHRHRTAEAIAVLAVLIAVTAGTTGVASATAAPRKLCIGDNGIQLYILGDGACPWEGETAAP